MQMAGLPVSPSVAAAVAVDIFGAGEEWRRRDLSWYM